MQPHIELTWEAVGVLTAIVSLISIGLGLYVKLSVRAELADFLKTLNGRYVYSKLCEERHGETQRRLQVLEEHDIRGIS